MRKIIKRHDVLLFLFLAIFAAPSYAISSNTSTFFETGERAVTDTIEDRDISGNYDFYKYYARLDQEVGANSRSPLPIFKYNIAYEYYHKDYEASDNLDADSNQWHAGIDYIVMAIHELPLQFSIDAGFRGKDYKNSPELGYERSNASVGLDLKHEDSWSASWDNGFIDYDYDKGGSDQLKLFTKLGGWIKFFEERFKAASSYKFQKVDQDTSKDRSERIFTVSSYYKLSAPHLDKISGYYSAGRNDTKDYEDEDREDDLLFKYSKWHIGARHPLTEKMDTAFKYGRVRRDYQNSDNDYRVWYLENKSGFQIYEDKLKKINFLAQVEHKEASYHLVDTLNYMRNLASAKISYSVKNNWELAPAFAFKKYDYSSSPSSDFTQYEAKMEFLTVVPALRSGRRLSPVEFNLAYKYIWKEYERGPDITQWSLRAGIEWMF